jgi:sec-independent protein translocase protein TatA
MLLANIFGGDAVIVVVIALVVIFGGSQLPKIARNVGTAGREFRKAQAEAEAEKTAETARDASVAPAPQAVGPAPASIPAATPAPAPAAPDDKITISKAELEALLDERLGKGSQNQA